MINYALILAAGKGTRMKTQLPKTLFPILKKPMIEYILDEVEKTSIKNTILVVGHQKELLMSTLGNRVEYVSQDEQLGTAHAVLQAKELLKDKPGSTLIMLGDMPLVDQATIESIINSHESSKNDLTLVTTFFDNPGGYGRVIRDNKNNLTGIIEELSASEDQKAIKEVNTGIYAVNNKILFDAIDKIEKDPLKGEYYLTDIISLLFGKARMGTYVIEDNSLVMGVNDLVAIAQAEKYFRNQINRFHMLNGISLINPETITIGHEVEIGEGVIIYPNTTITGKSKIKENAVIGPNTELHNAQIKKEVHVRHSLIYDSIVEERTTIGPFAHLRNNAHIGPNNRVGNFVEVKSSTTGKDTKAAHLAYIGDAVVGENVNFGAGSITVNYDGVNKHKTIIGDNVFIGCNTNLVAPITIEKNVFIAAGSTVTKDVPEGSLAIARGKQINKSDYYNNLIRPKNDFK
jgi:bifunctional UDP-N-acetylglucosamine pyrophosphorylase / glucosamine-1-phosphate N-acetyltransferase